MGFSQHISLKYIIVTSLLVFVIAFVKLGYDNKAYFKVDSILRETPDVDELDFHFIATNFALTNQFPVIGFLKDTSFYHIDYMRNHSMGVDSMYLNMFTIAGPVHTFVRPPLYPLLVGCLYKLFGVHLSVLLIFNVFLLALTLSLLPFIGFKLWQTLGLVSGCIASGVLLFFHDFSLITMDVEILANLLFLLLFAFACFYNKSLSLWYLLLIGIFFSLELLHKPIIIFLIPFYLVFLYFTSVLATRFSFGKQVLVLIIGMGMVLVPWSLYINQIKARTINERIAWTKKIQASLEYPVQYKTKADLTASEQNVIHVFRNFIKIMYIYHSDEDEKPTLLGNQFRNGVSLLFLNNEFCVDNIADMGSFGWLWKMISSSYYNTHHLGSSNIMKVFYFYYENPSYLYRIAWARLVNSSNTYPLIFWFAPVAWVFANLEWIPRKQSKFAQTKRLRSILLALFVMLLLLSLKVFTLPNACSVLLAYFPVYVLGVILLFRHRITLSLLFPLFWLSIFSFILFVYGDVRFTKIALAVNCLSMVYYSLVFLSDSYKILFLKQ